VYRRVSSGRQPTGFPVEEAARKDPPSTFLFLPIHLSNSPEIWRFPLPDRRRAIEAPCHPALRPAAFSPLSVRCFRGAPSRPVAGGASNGAYIGPAPD